MEHFSQILDVFKSAHSQDRHALLENEVYDVLKLAGLTSIPKYRLIKSPDQIDQSTLDEFPGDKIVLKVVSPYIMHKTDVGGVNIVKKTVDAVGDAIACMFRSIPASFMNWTQLKNIEIPMEIREKNPDKTEANIRKSIMGILLMQYINPSMKGFGYEMLLGIRKTREFGLVLTAGLGGTDTEYFAKIMKRGLASVSASTTVTSPQDFLRSFKHTVSYQKISGSTRGAERIIEDDKLIACFQAVIHLARFLDESEDSKYMLEEFEVNPFVFMENQPVPLDGMLKYSMKSDRPPETPVEKIKNLLHPKSLAVIGVSAQKLNMGRIILRNVIGNNYPKEHLYIIRPGIESIDDIPCVPAIDALPEKVDVLVLAVDASQAPLIIQEAAGSGKVESVIIIPGGLGEKSGTESIVANMNRAILDSRKKPDRGPIFVGGNCLGILSRPGNYDTLFVPEAKLPKNYNKSPDPVAFLSQSGARMITVMSQQSNLSPLFAISTGNQMDLGISDFLEYMAEQETDVRVLAVYVEGFKDLGGLKMIKTVRKLNEQNRTTIFYKAGRTPAGKTATSGHTASVAGDYAIAAQLLEEAGAIVCDNFTEFNELIRLAVVMIPKSIMGNRLSAISNAGYETVGIADNIGDRSDLVLASYTPETSATIQAILEEGRIENLIDIRNPMDVTPMATDDVHEKIIRAQINDANTDCVLAATVPLTPAQQTLPEGIFGKENIENTSSYPNRLIRLNSETSKPMIVVIDSGRLYDPLVQMLETEGLVVFRTADLALKIFGKYITNRLRKLR
ncbi:acetate--CoA ligase family protein [bacterium]|nr:acetate--CoA ligase family protein [candidate division CSSED10-310 bacterium]